MLSNKYKFAAWNRLCWSGRLIRANNFPNILIQFFIYPTTFSLKSKNLFFLSPSWEIKTLSVMALRSGVCKSILWSQVQIPQRFYNSWNAKIERSVEPERLLVFDVRSLVAALLNYSWQIFDSSLATFSFWSFRDGWGPLCKFLGVVQPRKPFPRYWALRMKILAESKESVASTNISSLHCPKYWTSLHNSQCSNLV